MPIIEELEEVEESVKDAVGNMASGDGGGCVLILGTIAFLCGIVGGIYKTIFPDEKEVEPPNEPAIVQEEKVSQPPPPPPATKEVVQSALAVDASELLREQQSIEVARSEEESLYESLSYKHYLHMQPIKLSNGQYFCVEKIEDGNVTMNAWIEVSINEEKYADLVQTIKKGMANIPFKRITRHAIEHKPKSTPGDMPPHYSAHNIPIQKYDPDLYANKSNMYLCEGGDSFIAYDIGGMYDPKPPIYKMLTKKKSESDHFVCRMFILDAQNRILAQSKVYDYSDSDACQNTMLYSGNTHVTGAPALAVVPEFASLQRGLIPHSPDAVFVFSPKKIIKFTCVMSVADVSRISSVSFQIE